MKATTCLQTLVNEKLNTCDACISALRLSEQGELSQNPRDGAPQRPLEAILPRICDLGVLHFRPLPSATKHFLPENILLELFKGLPLADLRCFEFNLENYQIPIACV